MNNFLPKSGIRKDEAFSHEQNQNSDERKFNYLSSSDNEDENSIEDQSKQNEKQIKQEEFSYFHEKNEEEYEEDNEHDSEDESIWNDYEEYKYQFKDQYYFYYQDDQYDQNSKYFDDKYNLRQARQHKYCLSPNQYYSNYYYDDNKNNDQIEFPHLSDGVSYSNSKQYQGWVSDYQLIENYSFFIKSLDFLSIFIFGDRLYQESKIKREYSNAALNVFQILIELPALKTFSQRNLIFMRIAERLFIQQKFEKSNLSLKECVFSSLPKNASIEDKKKREQEEMDYMYMQIKISMQKTRKNVQSLLQKYIKKQPKNEEGYFLFALFLFFKKSKAALQYLQKGEFVAATKDYQKSELYLILDVLRLNQQGNISERNKSLKECQKQYPQAPLCFVLLGNYLFEQKQYLEAINQFEKCISNMSQQLVNINSIPPNEEEIINCKVNLAICYQETGNKEHSMKQVEEILLLRKGHLQALQIKFQILLEGEKDYLIIKAMNSSLQSEQHDPITCQLLAKANLKNGNTISAISFLQKCYYIDSQFSFICLKIAAIYELIERPQKALNYFLTHLESFPNSAIALFKAAKFLTYFRKYNTAESLINKLFEVLKGSSDALIITPFKQLKLSSLLDNDSLFHDSQINLSHAYKAQGYLKKQMNHLSESLLYYNQALKLNAEDEETLLFLANVHHQLGNTIEEIEIYIKLISLTNISSEIIYQCLVNLGNCFQKQSQNKKAIYYYEKALLQSNHDKNHGIYQNIASCFLKEGKNDEAIATLNKVFERNIFLPELWYLFGVAYFNLGKMNLSCQYFEKVIKNDPFYEQAHYSLAKAKKTNGKIQEAIKICKKCLENNPSCFKVQLLLGDYFIQQGEYENSVSIFQSIVSKIQNSSERYLNSNEDKDMLVICNNQITRIYILMKEYDKASFLLDSSLAQCKGYSAYLHQLGKLKLQEGKNLLEAVSLFKQACKDCPNNPIYLMDLANALHQLNKIESEIQVLKQCVLLKPAFLDQIYNNIVMAYSQLKQKQNSLMYLQKGLEINPSSQTILFNLGNCYFESFQFKEAANFYQKCLQQDSQNQSALHNLGLVFMHLKNYQKSVDCFSKCRVLIPENKQYYSLLQQMFKRGYYPKWRFIFTGGVDGSVFVFKVGELTPEGHSVKAEQSENAADKELKIAVDDKLADVVLVERQEIDIYLGEQKKLKEEYENLENKMEIQSLEEKNKMDKEIREMENKMRTEIKAYEQRYEDLKSQKNRNEKDHGGLLKELEKTHLKAIEELENLYEKKLAFENEKFLQQEQELIEERMKFEKKLREIERKHDDNIGHLKVDFNDNFNKAQKVYDSTKQTADDLRKIYEERLAQQEEEHEQEIREMNESHKKEMIKLKRDLAAAEEKKNKFDEDNKRAKESLARMEKIDTEKKSRIDYLESRLADASNQIEALNQDIRSLEDLAKKKEKKIHEYKYKINDLQKSKHVLSFRTTEMRKSLEPKEEQIEKQKDQLCKLEGEFEGILKVSESRNDKLKKMQSQIENLNKNLKLQTELTNQKENILNKIIMEIHDCVKNKDVKEWGGEMQNLYQLYVQETELKQIQYDKKGVQEMGRQIQHLNKTIQQISESSNKLLDRRYQDIFNKTKENAELIYDLNDMRKQNKEFSSQISNMRMKEDKYIKEIANLKAENTKYKNSTGFKKSAGVQLPPAISSQQQQAFDEQRQTVQSQQAASKNNFFPSGQQGQLPSGQVQSNIRPQSMKVGQKGTICRGKNFDVKTLAIFDKAKMMDMTTEMEHNTQKLLQQELLIKQIRRKIHKHALEKGCSDAQFDDELIALQAQEQGDFMPLNPQDMDGSEELFGPMRGNPRR